MPSCSASFFNSSVVLRDFTLRMTLIPEDVFFTVTKSDASSAKVSVTGGKLLRIQFSQLFNMGLVVAAFHEHGQGLAAPAWNRFWE